MDSNPFGDDEDSSIAFADPSVERAVYEDSVYEETTYDDGYGAVEVPLDDEEDSSSTKTGLLQSIGIDKSDAKDSSLSSRLKGNQSNQNMRDEEYGQSSKRTRKEQDLADREAEIQRREEQLAERESNLDSYAMAGGAMRPNNWPVEMIGLFYHNINEEVEPSLRALCRKFYAAFLWTWICIVFNWVCMIIFWFSGGTSSGATEFIWSTAYLLFGLPISLKGWYQPMYNILKNMRTGKGGTTNWMMFFCIFGSHVVFAGIMALGIPDIGAAGLFEMLNAFGNDDNLGGLFILSCTIAWSVNFAMSVYLMKRAHAIWKGNGGEADMKRDVATTAIKEGVLNAA